MKLYLKRDTGTTDTLFIVLDEFCKEKYYVTGTKEKLKIYNLKDEKVTTIRKMPLPSIRAYLITAYKQSIRLVMSDFKSKMTFNYYGINWHIRGNVFTNSYDILDLDNSVVSVCAKKFATNKSCCELNIFDESKELFSVATAICANIDEKVDKPKLQTV